MSGNGDSDIHAEAVAAGDSRAFAQWIAAAEPRVRLSLRSFAAQVDAEVVVQETLLRIWQVAPKFKPDGRPDGLIRLAVRVARNLAITELRRRHPAQATEAALDGLASVEAPSIGAEDPHLNAAVRTCFEALPDKPRSAMDARMRHPGARDEALARGLGMAPNTFVQNARRARLAMLDCLQSKGHLLEPAI